MDEISKTNDAVDGRIAQVLSNVYTRCIDDRSGQLANYIPELAAVDAERFGIAIATAGGHIHQIGDAEVPFTIQSVSKAFIYAVAIEVASRRTVLNRVGVEPSGDAFNAIVFDPRTNHPFNPMVNAGAITVTGIIHDVVGNDAFALILKRLSEAAGRQLDVDESVYRSESETGHRNRAIGHLLRNVGVLRGSVDTVLDLYFRQCAILVTASDLARMGATLANMGENPVTGKQVFDLAAVRDTLAVMFTCGMYDYSGHWALDVGIPAKSGVGGGIVGMVNRQVGIGTLSPRLDDKGNSVRGLKAFKDIGDELGLHAFEFLNVGSSYVSALLRPSANSKPPSVSD